MCSPTPCEDNQICQQTGGFYQCLSGIFFLIFTTSIFWIFIKIYILRHNTKDTFYRILPNITNYSFSTGGVNREFLFRYSTFNLFLTLKEHCHDIRLMFSFFVLL